MSAHRRGVGVRLFAATGTMALLGWMAACSASGSGDDTAYPPVGGSGGDQGDTGPGDTGGSAGSKADGGDSGGTAGKAGADASDAKPDVPVEASGDVTPDQDGGAGGSDAGKDASDAEAGPCSSNPEVCDGLDNNCNNQVDEGNPGGGQTCQTGKPGVCSAGTTQCINGQIKCVQNELPGVEVCDGTDNNCDGNVDEGDPGGGTQCDTGLLGLCKAGITHCTNGSVQCVGLNAPKGEVCNGLDDDCNGSIDNGSLPGVGVACSVPGQNPNTPCGKSVSVCTAGQIQCPQTYQAQSETCNGIDDDCNGTIDDPGSVNGQPCSTGLLGICDVGSSYCQAGSPKCNPTVNPGDKPEICNNKDDNCNGSVDEMNATTACTVQYPAAQYVAAWDCAQGNCQINTCQSNHFDINSSIGDGCECNMAAYGSACGAGTAVSVPLNTPQANPITRTGGIPTANGSAWFVVTFAKPSLGTPYHFRVSLTDAHGTEFKMNVRTTCSNFASCTDGANKGQDATTWETATGYINGPGCCADSPAPPSQVYVEVYRATPGLTCDTFTVAFMNY
ncbi:MAG: putative metal-binding motif-containing protein [Deltaproteobacteria bacterium]|nr:putative metal-binding motif-containing protein [Deltaproteobacteria bacterium]